MLQRMQHRTDCLIFTGLLSTTCALLACTPGGDTLTARLMATTTTARVFVLRQNGAHAEDAERTGVSGASATVSDVVEVPLR